LLLVSSGRHLYIFDHDAFTHVSSKPRGRAGERERKGRGQQLGRAHDFALVRWPASNFDWSKEARRCVWRASPERGQNATLGGRSVALNILSYASHGPFEWAAGKGTKAV
ncbi:unnamed protein product, partial [Scytosiphon promiscuus]